ncbi:MAG: DUF2461 family protein [Bacteroidota bacterium]
MNRESRGKGKDTRIKRQETRDRRQETGDKRLDIREKSEDSGNKKQDIALLNYKDYTVLKPLEEDLLTSEQLTEKVMEAFETVYPLNQFINEAIAFHAED